MPVARSVRPEEVDRAGDVGAIAFGGETDDWRRSFRNNVDQHGLDCVIVVEHEGEIVSSMQVVPEGMRFGEATLPAAAVAGVGTIPEARRIGCAAAMLEEATRRMRAWGAAASPMWPFSFVYYRKFGWEIGGEARVVKWKRDIAWKIEPRGEVAPVTADDTDAVASVWEATAGNHRCATATESRDYAGRFQRYLGKPDWGGLIVRVDGKPAAYALYHTPERKEGEESPSFEIMEMRSVDAAAEIGILNALAEMSEYPTLLAHRPADDRLRSIAVNPRDLVTRLADSFGFRVVDPAQILRTLRTNAPLPPVHIHVEDALLGSGTWKVAFPGGPAEVEKTAAEPDLACSITAFSQIASGFLKPAVALRLGLLTGDSATADRLNTATAGWTLPFRDRTERG